MHIKELLDNGFKKDWSKSNVWTKRKCKENEEIIDRAKKIMTNYQEKYGDDIPRVSIVENWLERYYTGTYSVSGFTVELDKKGKTNIIPNIYVNNINATLYFLEWKGMDFHALVLEGGEIMEFYTPITNFVVLEKIIYPESFEKIVETIKAKLNETKIKEDVVYSMELDIFTKKQNKYLDFVEEYKKVMHSISG